MTTELMLRELRQRASELADPTERDNFITAIDDFVKRWRPLWRHPDSVQHAQGDESGMQRQGHRIGYENKFTTFDTRDPHTTGVLIFGLLRKCGGKAEINWPAEVVRYNRGYMITDIKQDVVTVEIIGHKADLVIAT